MGITQIKLSSERQGVCVCVCVCVCRCGGRWVCVYACVHMSILTLFLFQSHSTTSPFPGHRSSRWAPIMHLQPHTHWHWMVVLLIVLRWLEAREDWHCGADVKGVFIRGNVFHPWAQCICDCQCKFVVCYRWSVCWWAQTTPTSPHQPARRACSSVVGVGVGGGKWVRGRVCGMRWGYVLYAVSKNKPLKMHLLVTSAIRGLIILHPIVSWIFFSCQSLFNIAVIGLKNVSILVWCIYVHTV